MILNLLLGKSSVCQKAAHRRSTAILPEALSHNGINVKLEHERAVANIDTMLLKSNSCGRAAWMAGQRQGPDVPTTSIGVDSHGSAKEVPKRVQGV